MEIVTPSIDPVVENLFEIVLKYTLCFPEAERKRALLLWHSSAEVRNYNDVIPFFEKGDLSFAILPPPDKDEWLLDDQKIMLDYLATAFEILHVSKLHYGTSKVHLRYQCVSDSTIRQFYVQFVREVNLNKRTYLVNENQCYMNTRRMGSILLFTTHFFRGKWLKPGTMRYLFPRRKKLPALKPNARKRIKSSKLQSIVRNREEEEEDGQEEAKLDPESTETDTVMAEEGHVSGSEQ